MLNDKMKDIQTRLMEALDNNNLALYNKIRGEELFTLLDEQRHTECDNAFGA